MVRFILESQKATIQNAFRIQGLFPLVEGRHVMNRREFIFGSAALGASVALGCSSHGEVVRGPDPIGWQALEDLRIIDAHAHPDQFYSPDPGQVDRSSTIEQMTEMGMEASVFAALGDRVAQGRAKTNLSEFQLTLVQIKRVRSMAAQGKIRLLLNADDIPAKLLPGEIPGALLAIEGGEALEGRIENVERFYRAGVRMITLIHQRPNGLGDSVNTSPEYGGLTNAGSRMVEVIQEAGMVLDVAHATSPTLKDIVRISRAPVIDSHTVPTGEKASPGRFRAWKDLELIAGSRGVVCTCPWRTPERKTLEDWAREILLMKGRIGIDHVGLGTDGGGNLPDLIRGYRDVRDLVHLVHAMQETGLGSEDIQKFMGGNFYRVIEECLGG